MIVSGRFKHAGDSDGDSLLCEESSERVDPFSGIGKHLMDCGAIVSRTRGIELRLANVDANADYGWIMRSK
jgi:hypothetical protein